MRLLLSRETLSRLLEDADVSVRLNEMTGEGEWAEGATRHDPLSPLWEKISRYPDNVLLGHVRSRVATDSWAWQWKMSLCDLLDTNVVNPFQEWLATLPAWDGEPRLDRLLDRVLDVDPSCDAGLVAWASRHLVMGAITRQLHGRGDDYSATGEGDRSRVPLLAGPRHAFYTSFATALLPPEPFARHWECKVWACDFGDETFATTNVALRTRGSVFAVIDDLLDQPRDVLRRMADGLGREYDVPARRWDRGYAKRQATKTGGGRAEYDYRRRAVLVPSASKRLDNLATIPNLNSLLVGIPVRKDFVRREHVKDPNYWDQLWAEALKRLNDGESFRFPEDLAPAAQDANARLVGALSRYCR